MFFQTELVDGVNALAAVISVHEFITAISVVCSFEQRSEHGHWEFIAEQAEPVKSAE
jgi:hypothetical protein